MRVQPSDVQNPGVVEAVSRGPHHEFSKANAARIRLLAGLGVEGDELADSGAAWDYSWPR